MNISTGWSNEEVFRFIELYQFSPEIWNPRHKWHKDKSKVIDAWNRIAEEMQVPVPELKKKKETLLSAFRVNHKKVIASLDSGEIHKPVWVFYDALATFLGSVYETKPTHSTEDSSDAREGDEEILDVKPSVSQLKKSKNPSERSTTPVQKKQNESSLELTEISKHMKAALSTITEVLAVKKKRVEKAIEDDCDLYGRLVAQALREFDETERLELRHEIDGLIIRKKHSINSRRHAVSQSQIISTNCYDVNV